MLAAWGLVFAFPHELMGLFTDNQELVETGAGMLHIYFFGFCFMAFQMSGQATFTGLGKAKFAIFFSLFRKVALVLPLIFILPRFPGCGRRAVVGAHLQPGGRRSLLFGNDADALAEAVIKATSEAAGAASLFCRYEPAGGRGRLEKTKILHEFHLDFLEISCVNCMIIKIARRKGLCCTVSLTLVPTRFAS